MERTRSATVSRDCPNMWAASAIDRSGWSMLGAAALGGNFRANVFVATLGLLFDTLLVICFVSGPHLPGFVEDELEVRSADTLPFGPANGARQLGVLGYPWKSADDARGFGAHTHSVLATATKV